MTLSLYESITASDGVVILLPSLSQTNLGIVAGTSYRLAFDTVISSGVLQVYQGSQLIYTSASAFIGPFSGLSDSIFVTESVTLLELYVVSVFNSVTITENVSLSIV